MINQSSISFRLIFNLLIFYAIVGCSSKNEKQIPVELKASGIFLEIPLDDSTANISDGLSFFPEESLLFNLNWTTNGIQIYDLNKKAKIKDLKFDYEGPSGVLDIMGIYVHSLDSIFLFNQLEPEITVIDTSGRIINRINYESPDMYSPAFVHNAYFTSPPILKVEKMLVKTHFYGPIQKMTQEELQSKELIYEIDLKSGKSRFLDFKFPKDYMPEGLKLFEASIAKGAGKYVYSMFGDHRLFFSAEPGDTIQSKDGKSEFLPQSLPLFPVQGDGLNFRKYSYYSPHYESLAFDTYRNVFIRFAFHDFEQDESVPPSDMRNHSGPFSIQVFDSDLNLISETPFEANQYHPFDYFITEKGLYISINHPLNPKNQEDKLTFELLEFTPIQK
jgi:hypothetical protein